MKHLLALPVLWCVATTPAVAQSAKADSAAAVAAIGTFHAALAAGDSARAVAQLADDLLVIESGAIQTRAQYLGGHLGADMKASQGSNGERSVVAVAVIGDVAWVTARTLTNTAGPTGPAVSESAELMIVARSAGGWKIRAVHWSSRRRRS